MRKKLILIMIFTLFIILAGCQKKVSNCEEPLSDNNTCFIDIENYENKDGVWDYNYNDTNREYILYLPEGIVKGAPIVFVLHGYAGSAIEISQYSKMNKVADDFGFAVVYPQGMLYNGDSHWNSDLDFSNIDDEGFLISLGTYISTTFNLSKDNMFLSGHSNGGYMGYAISKNSPGFFKAIASIAGTMSYNTWNSENPVIPTNILQIHGTSDDTVLIDGSMPYLSGFGGAPKMTDVIEYWTEINNVSTLSFSEIEDTNIYRYTNEENSNQVWYYEIEGQGHWWPYEDSTDGEHISGINAQEVIWEFFSEFID